MPWIPFLDNVEAVTSLFGADRDFPLVDLHEATLGRDGPVLRLRFDVPAVPPTPPRRWPPGTNTTQFTMAAWGVSALAVNGWASQVEGEISVSHARHEYRLLFISPRCRIEASCTLLRMERVVGYTTVSEGPPASRRDPR